jgi:predicted  nucleic acid-binding Zn-ribbon protein
MGLKAAPEDQALLLEVQEFDTRLQQLDHRLRTLPETARLAELAGASDALRRDVAEQRGALEDAQAELGRVESDVAVVEARIARDRGRLEATSSVKDVQALEQELAALARRRDELEEIELVVMEKVEELEVALSSIRLQLDAHEAEVAETTAARDAAAASVDEERRRVTADRETVAARVPAELLALYEKQRARYGVGASHLRAGVSSASGVALNATDLGAVRAAAPDDVLLCPDSSAILVRTAESGL